MSDGSGKWQVRFVGNQTAAGSVFVLSATVTDLAGNTSSSSASFDLWAGGYWGPKASTPLLSPTGAPGSATPSGFKALR